MNAAGVGSGISVCNQTINTCTWADITAASFVFPDTLNRIYNSVSNSSFTGIAGSAASCTFSRSGGTQGGFTSSIQSINNCIDSTRCDGNTQYIYYLTPYNLLNYGAETIQYKSIINQAQTNATYYGKIYTLWDPSSVTLTYNGALSSLTIVSFSGTSGLKVYDYTATPIYYITSTATIAGSATTPNTIYRFYGINRNGDQYYSTNIIACAAYVDTCTWANITYAEFAPPDTAKRIYNSSLNASIVGITGNYTSYTFTRTGGTQGTFTSSIQTGNSCIDPTTNLTQNTLYTYKIYPINKLGYNSTNNAFTTTTNKYRSSPTSTGTIYTLADPTLLVINQNNNNSTSSAISMNISSTNYTYIVIPYFLGTYYNSFIVTQNNTFTTGQYSNLSPNTIYNIGFYVLNSDLIGKDLTVCYKTVNACTLANITGTPTFCYTDTQKRIYNSTTNSTITDITGNYSYYIVTLRSGIQVTYTSPQQTTSTFIDPTTNLTPNTGYSYWIYPYNQYNFCLNPFSTTYNPLQVSSTLRNGNTGYIYTLVDPSSITITNSILNSTVSLTITYNPRTFVYTNTNTLLTGTVSGSSNVYSFNGLYNTLYVFTIKIYNNEPFYSGSTDTNVGYPTIFTYSVCSDSRFNICSFVKPIALNSITDTNSVSLINVTYYCAYYTITRTGGTQGTITNTVNVDNSTLLGGTITNSIFTGLDSNTLYTFVINSYNRNNVKSTYTPNIINQITNPNGSIVAAYNKIYTLADPLNCVITQSAYNSVLAKKPISYAPTNTGYKQVYFYTTATYNGPYTNQQRIGPSSTGSTSINCVNPIPANAAITLMVDNGDYYGNTLAVCMRAIPFSS